MVRAGALACGSLLAIILLGFGAPAMSDDGRRSGVHQRLHREILSDKKEIRQDRKGLRADIRELRRDRKSGAGAEGVARDKHDDLRGSKGGLQELREDRRELRQHIRELRRDRREGL